jgi:hypothetical protein
VATAVIAYVIVRFGPFFLMRRWKPVGAEALEV